MTTAALGTYYDIGGLNGFSDINTSTPAAANAMGDNAGFGNYSRWLDYEKPMGYGLFASLDGGGGEIDIDLWIKEVIIRSRQTSHQRTMANPMVQNIHRAGANFWRHPITRGVTTVLTSFVGGGIFSGMKNAYTAVKGYRYANVAKNGLTNEQLVTKAGQKAFDVIPGKGPTVGTARHEYATSLLQRYQKIYGNRGLEFKVRSPDGKAILDVLDTKKSIIYDWKFGAGARMSNNQLMKYQFYFPNNKITPLFYR
jgi:hypothetical protein